MPLQPKWPNSPVLGGMNGCQLAVLMYFMPKAITSSTIATFTYTMMLLNFADSLIPITSSVVRRSTRTTAGRFMMPAVSVNPADTQLATVIAVWLTASTATPPVAGSTQTCAGTRVCVPSTVNGAPVSAGGRLTPRLAMKAVKYPDQPTATVEAAKRYSRIRAQPTVHAPR